MKIGGKGGEGVLRNLLFCLEFIDRSNCHLPFYYVIFFKRIFVHNRFKYDYVMWVKHIALVFVPVNIDKEIFN